MTLTRLALAAACAVALTGCGGGDDASDGGALEVTGTVTASGSGDQQAASLDMTDELSFEPNQVKAAVGRLALTVENAGRIPHNLVFADEALGKTDTVKGKATATLTVALSKAGTYRFTCTFHPGMDGEVTVS